MRKFSIGIKVMGLIIGIGILFVPLLALYAPERAKQLSTQIMVEYATYISKLLSENLVIGVETIDFDDGAGIDEILALLKEEKGEGHEENRSTITRVRVFNEEKTFLRGLNADSQVTDEALLTDSLVTGELENTFRLWTPLKDSDDDIIGWAEIDFSKDYLNNATTSNTRNSLIIAFSAFAIVMFLGLWFSRRVVSNLFALESASQKLAVGDIDVDINVKSNDEIQSLADAFEQMIELLRNRIGLANDIAGGNLDTRVEIASDNDELGKSMESMRTSLKSNREEVRTALSEASSKVEYLNNLTFPIHVVDKDLNIVYINPPAAELTSMSIEDCVGKNAVDLFGTDHYDDNTSDTVKALTTGEVSSSEGFLEVNGEQVPFSFTSAPVRDKNGNILGAIEQGFNIANIKGVVREVNRVAESLKQGDLSAKAFNKLAQGDYLQLVESFNSAIENTLDPINEAIQCLDQMSDGDLTIRMNGNYQGDHNKIKDALNVTLDSFHDIMSQVNNMVSELASCAVQISETSDNLSQGSNTQTMTMSEVSSMVVDIENRASKNADSAHSANDLAEDVAKKATLGQEQMASMLAAMEEINKASGDIANIIRTIDEIAFQTNLLSLNAAVEAARAGIHGKGFSVVADEVRNLAQRSSQAAKETTELIDSTIAKVKNGSTIANSTAEALGEITNGVQKVTDLITEINRFSSDQSESIENINGRMNQIDNINQDSLSRANELSVAADQLSGLSGQLETMIKRFQLEAGSGNGQGHEERRMLPSADEL